MEYMTTREAKIKWNISERRIRQLLQEGRIEGAVKVGSIWNIPKNAIKPTDKRIVRPDNNEFIINLDNNYFNEIDNIKKKLDILHKLPMINTNYFALQKVDLSKLVMIMHL